MTDIEDPIRVLEQAWQAGVTSLLSCGYHAASNAAVVELRRRVPRMPIAIGLHPYYATEAFGPVKTLILDQHPVAIGECGLDGYAQDSAIPSLETQRPVFEAQLDLATRLKLPLIVHSRRAVNDVVAMAANFPTLRGVLHAYSGSFEQVEPLLARGWLVGIGGAITRPRARRIRRMAVQLEISQLLFETDAPAIGLEGVLPSLVRPHHVVDVARAFVELRGLDYEEVVAQTDQNALRMFGDGLRSAWMEPQ